MHLDLTITMRKQSERAWKLRCGNIIRIRHLVICLDQYAVNWRLAVTRKNGSKAPLTAKFKSMVVQLSELIFQKAKMKRNTTFISLSRGRNPFSSH